jgi:heterodisulfide reductase subunit B
VCDALGIELKELEDWNCCGSTSAHSVDAELAQLLPLRNLEIAESAGHDLMVPCAACYGRSKSAEVAFRKGELDAETTYTGGVQINHILDFLVDDEVFAALRERMVQPLTGLKAVCYYGCLTVRPPDVTGARNPEDPDSMDRLVALTGATALPWAYKTDCCGASLTLTRADVVVRLVDRLVTMAEEAEADCIVVACSMCHANLDGRQAEAAAELGNRHRMPILYISELLGLAMGLPQARQWWGKHLTDPVGVLGARGLA